MAKFLLVVARDGVPLPEQRIADACALVAPDNLEARAPDFRTRPGMALAVIGPSPSVRTHETSVCLGQMFGAPERWWVPRGPVPDGTYALVRADDDAAELCADGVATRSIYYARTDDLFVASSSQRAIAAVVGRFRLSPVALSWMLSSGALGPGGAWDDSVVRLAPDDRVLLDRRAWKVTTQHRPVAFEAQPGADAHHAALLREAVATTCDAVDLGGAEWRLPLSGGHDSRCLAVSLARRYHLQCITWGIRDALDDPSNDAFIAQVLAQRIGLPHAFYPMDASTEPVEVLFERFLTNGDGAVDHISAYMDGFEVWRHLHEQGVAGVVRGDEGFGWERVALTPAVRLGLDAMALGDYYPASQLHAWGLADQGWPAELQRGRHESLATWRDRLYHAYRIPTILASLTDLKTSYVDIVNPLLSRRILQVVRALPDHLRTEKILFKQLVESISPDVPIATRNAVPDYGALVRSPAFTRLTRDAIRAGAEQGSLPGAFAAYLLDAVPAPAQDGAGGRRGAELAWGRGRAVKTLRAVVPIVVRNTVRALRIRPPAARTLAFRAAIASRMAQHLASAAAGRRAPRAAAAP